MNGSENTEIYIRYMEACLHVGLGGTLRQTARNYTHHPEWDI